MDNVIERDELIDNRRLGIWGIFNDTEFMVEQNLNNNEFYMEDDSAFSLSELAELYKWLDDIYG